MSTYDFDCGCKFEVKNDTIKACDGLPSIYIDYNKELNYNCQNTLALFASGKTKGVFQLEESLGKIWSKRSQPTSIEDISALVSLIRPSCLNAKLDNKSMTQHYVDRKMGREEVTYIHPALERILDSTYSVIAYQEQAIRIASEIAGFNLQQADTLRRSCGKKDALLMRSLKTTFIEGCKTVGLVSEEQANELFDNIEKSNRYSFNKCILGTTKLFRDKGCHKFTPTVEEMFKIKNDLEYAKFHKKLPLRSKYNRVGYGNTLSKYQDGRIRPNKIIDIRYAGKREVFVITLENGAAISVTDNHKFPTETGEKTLLELKVGENLYIKGEYEICNKKYNHSNIKQCGGGKEYEGYGFPQGQSNPGYTNGAYTEFKLNNAMLPKKCYDCGNNPKRIETHHIDGDRTNSNIENLVNLCPSCHKKREYAVGRVKRGEKGYPTLTSKIQSIVKLDGLHDVYDVEMDTPNHNFVVDTGIVTCNSHAVAYSQISFWTAYAKVHFPLHFCCSYLHYAREKISPQEEVDAIISDSKNLNVDILTPDIRCLFNGDPGDFAISNMKINFGIRSIKGCGDKNIEKLLEIVKKGEETLQKSIDKWNWTELLFLVLVKVSKTVVNGLISVGGCSHFGLSRQKMLHEYSIASNINEKELALIGIHLDRLGSLEDCLQFLVNSEEVKRVRKEKVLSLIKGLNNPPFSLDDTVSWIAEKERFYLGSPISCIKAETVDVVGNTTCKEFSEGKNAKQMSLVGEIKSMREYILKAGKQAGMKMCFGTLEDVTGRIDFVLSVNKYEELRDIAYSGNIVMLVGKRSKNESLQVERMVTV